MRSTKPRNQVVFEPAVREQFYRLPAADYQRVRALVDALAESPFPPRPTRVGGLGEPANVYCDQAGNTVVHYEVDLATERIVITHLEAAS